MLKYKVNLDKVGLESANKAYGGNLDAYSFFETSFDDWFSDFRKQMLTKIGTEYFPIYRMADGEYRFLMGRTYNWYRKPLYKEIIAVTLEKLRVINPDKWKTSWGEEYSPDKVKSLRSQLIRDIDYISKKGMLGCFYNTNGLNAYQEYNSKLLFFFKKFNIKFDKNNYIPFHFICAILVKEGWKEFYINRHILIVTGSDDKSEVEIEKSLIKLGTKQVSFLRISKSSSMEEKLDLQNLVYQNIDIAFVAAGIGSANILKQLEPLKTLTIDIGGYMNCFKDSTSRQHGGIFKLPQH